MISNFYGSIKSVQRYNFFSTYASARAFFLYFPYIFVFFCMIKYQISNLKSQFIPSFITSECYSDIGSADLSRIKYQISNINLFLRSLRRNSIPTSALPTSSFITSEFYSDIGSADLSVHYVGILFRHRLCRPLPSSDPPPPLFFSPSERGLGGVLPLLGSSAGCYPAFFIVHFVPSLGQPHCLSFSPPLRGGWGVSPPPL